jgi:hypothetical protein
MVTLDGTPVSQSVHRFWREIGGTQGLARALQTDIRVRKIRPNYHTALEGSTFLSLINASRSNKLYHLFNIHDTPTYRKVSEAPQRT